MKLFEFLNTKEETTLITLKGTIKTFINEKGVEVPYTSPNLIQNYELVELDAKIRRNPLDIESKERFSALKKSIRKADSGCIIVKLERTIDKIGSHFKQEDGNLIGLKQTVEQLLINVEDLLPTFTKEQLTEINNIRISDLTEVKKANAINKIKPIKEANIKFEEFDNNTVHITYDSDQFNIDLNDVKYDIISGKQIQKTISAYLTDISVASIKNTIFLKMAQLSKDKLKSHYSQID